MDLINKKDPQALTILKHLSFLDNTNIEFELIQEIFLNETETNLKQSVDYLIKIGYLKEIGEEVYEMPKLIQIYVSSILDNEYEIELRVIQTLITIIMTNRILRLKIQLEEVKKIYKHVEKFTLNDDKSEFQLNNFNAKLIKKSKEITDFNYYKMENSILMGDKVIRIIKKYCKLKIKTCKMRTSKGVLKRQLGKYDEALQIFEKVLTIQKNYYIDENNKEIARTYENIGLVLYYKGEYNQAMEYHFKSLEIKKKNFTRKSH